MIFLVLLMIIQICVFKLICNFLNRIMPVAERYGHRMSVEPKGFCFPRETSGWDEM